MSWFSTLVVHAAGFEVKTGVPGPVNINEYGILGYIQNAYLLALGVAAALAIGSIIYGAVQYTASRGNPSKLSDAWDRIIQALVGILLLVGAGTLLSIVNPGLLSLELPKIEQLDTPFSGDAYNQIPTDTVDDDAPPPPGTPVVTPPAGSGCITSRSSCTTASAAGFRCQGSGCGLMVSTIAECVRTTAQSLGISPGSITFTGAYPPSINPPRATGRVSHCSRMHYNGCNADLVLPTSYARTCSDVTRFVTALSSCGVKGLNEYRTGAFANCGQAGSGASTGNHVHMQGCPNGTFSGIPQSTLDALSANPNCRR